MRKYSLPKLDYNYSALEPFMSEEQLRIHHSIHHQGYVNNSNAILQKLNKSRNNKKLELDMKSTLKALSFNLAGHILHSKFWKNLAPAKNKNNEPSGRLAKVLKENFKSVKQFKKEFTQAAATVEGSGWAVLVYDQLSKKLIILQIEKHNVNLIPSLQLLLVVDVWEHAYYLDYKNARGKFLDAFWNIVNWREVGKQLNNLRK